MKAELKVTLVGLCLALVGRLAAQEAGSLKNLDLDVSNPRRTSDAVAVENLSLKKRLAETDRSLRTLQESFGLLSSEAEVFRRKSVELSARIESLGTGTLDARLLKLLNELKLVREERLKLQDSLIQLSEAILQYQRSPESKTPGAATELEAAVRNAAKVLGSGPVKSPEKQPTRQDLANATVVSVEDDLALIVANVGLRHGVKIGMPFEVVRGEDVVATLRIVDIRDQVSGALIQNLSKEKTIKVGDHLKVIAN